MHHGIIGGFSGNKRACVRVCPEGVRGVCFDTFLLLLSNESISWCVQYGSTKFIPFLFTWHDRDTTEDTYEYEMCVPLHCCTSPANVNRIERQPTKTRKQKMQSKVPSTTRLSLFTRARALHCSFFAILFAIVCILVYWFIWTRNCAHIPNRPANLRIQLKSDCVEKFESPSGSGGAGEREKEAKHRTVRLSIQIEFRPSARTIQSQYVGESRKILTEMWTGGGHFFFSRDLCVWEYWMQYAN